MESRGPAGGGTVNASGDTGPAGLRRLVEKKPLSSELAAPKSSTPEGLRRILERDRGPRPRPGEACEMCATDIPDEHAHVVNLESRSLMCACRPCYLLFTSDIAARGKYRSVPDRYLYDAHFRMTDSQWNDIQIPVRMAFFFVNSSIEHVAAFYPSPAGATESLLDLKAWDDVMAANAETFGDMLPDVEALLINRREEGFECFLVPIDACYALVGRVRMHWRGFDGGTEAWAEIDSFFDSLRERSRKVGAAQ